ncbi:MAG: TIGR03000 domain-containing protein [Planctomycetia bacterium]|nr:TIGR03000 domain-containing protein [Planctomycetia bacterium]
MYSIVLMTALTTAPEAPQFHGYFRDLFHRDSNGCGGCGGGAMRYAGCAGVAASPASCNGCNGGVFGLGLADRTRRFFDRDSGYGCTGRSYGCFGASYSCSGYACSGSAYSCFGGPAYSYTPVFNGGLSCQGGFPMPAPPPNFDTFPGTPNIPFAVPDPAPPMAPPGTIGLRPASHNSPALMSNGPTGRATVIVKLPADAKLTADGRQLKLTGAERKFVTPELPRGQEFTYRFKVEYDRDGETVSVTKKVNVRAGGTVTVEFVDLTAAKPAQSDKTSGTPTSTAPPAVVPPVTPTPEPAKAAPSPPETPVIPPSPGGDRATITVKLPPGATLYVDDRKSPSKDPVRQFSTPPLPAGREYAYLLRAEVIRNGQPETITQKVPFRAGERVTVDFTSLGK